MTLFLTASYTYWRCFLEGSFIATSKGPGFFIPSDIAQPSYAPSFDYQSGFKVGGGLYLTNSFKLMGNYTLFYNHPNIASSGLEDDPQQDDFLNFQPSADLDFLETQFTNTFNRVDGYLEREFRSGNSLSLSPQIGLQGAWETAHLNYNFVFGNEQFNGITTFKQNWWGIGPYIGAEFVCYFYDHIVGMSIKPCSALLIAEHRINELARLFDDEGDLNSTPINVSYSLYSVEPMIDATIGALVKYETKRWMVRADIGWQAQTYFYHNGFFDNEVSNLQRGNYSMQGLTASVAVGF